MAFINKISSFLLGAAAITVPTGIWEKIIMWFHSGITSYGWAIIIFTIAIKVIMLPFDFVNKRVTEKNTRVQAIIQPEIQKIQKQYGNNKQVVNQKTMELYKKHNYNVTGSCFVTILNMGLTLLIFITLLSGLNSMAAYKVGYQYQEMEKTYHEYVISTGYDTYLTEYENAYNIKIEDYISGEETPEDLTTEQKEEIENYARAEAESAVGGKTEEELLIIIHQAVANTYEKEKESWLWISNVWKSDTPWTKSSTSFEEFNKMAGITYKTGLAEGEQETFKIRLESNKSSDERTYNAVMKSIENYDRSNGYLIIPLLAVATTVLSILATQGKLKRKKKGEIKVEKTTPATGGIFMVVLMGGLMGYITLTYNSVFALYITVGSIFGIATTPLVNLCIKIFNKWLENRKSKKIVKEDYKR